MIQRWMDESFWERLIALKKLIYVKGITYRGIHLFASSGKGAILKRIMGTMSMSHIMVIEIQRAW
nr:uncharacterized protein LOC102625412 isoform X2 [Ipomoea batatas]GMC72469.1 uncharacterized protein LOC102625412 isoform X2 [Ipomoea batatas]GMC74583.1 uncharacterized protein LOC102625412 isoform X2 [Ipomoea batatas]